MFWWFRFDASKLPKSFKFRNFRINRLMHHDHFLKNVASCVDTFTRKRILIKVICVYCKKVMHSTGLLPQFVFVEVASTGKTKYV